MTRFIRVLHESTKAVTLASAIQRADASQRFVCDPSAFQLIPGSPFAYWVSDGIRSLFTDLYPLEKRGRTAKQGLATSDDFRFVRAWWSIRPSSNRWRNFAKGGENAAFYSDLPLVVGWSDYGEEMKAWAGSQYGGSHWSRILKNTDYFFRGGVTWPRRTQSGLSMRGLPSGCVFGDKGPAIFVANDRYELLASTLATVSSKPFHALVELQMAFGSYEVGVIQRTPFPELSSGDVELLGGLAREAWGLKRGLDERVEVSHAFVLPGVLLVSGGSLAVRADGWWGRVRDGGVRLAEIQAEIDERCFALYGIEEADRQAIVEGFGAPAAAGVGDVEEPGEDESEVEEPGDLVGLAAELVSWAVGVAFGRFDVRLATGERELPGSPEPFDRLPVCSAGMLVGDDGLPVDEPPAGYPLAFAQDGILVDDSGDGRDLVGRVRQVFEVVFGGQADAIWQEASELLDPKGQDVRRWLSSSFFGFHLKQYSKSRRKAPVVWQLATPSGRFSVWLYAHRLTADSFFQVQNDVVAPKLVHEERRLTSLIQSAQGSPSARDRREIDAQETFVEELGLMLDEVKRVAPLWSPTLDDGVVLVMAPLWQLVALRSWRKELKTKWDELGKGKYDWAHLAMRLWPQRVVPKCATDRSLAIAHGLEGVFWVQDEDDRWHAREVPTKSIESLIAERHSPTINNALGSGATPPPLEVAP